MKRSEAAEIVMLLLGAYPQAKTTASTSQVYETMLSDLDVGSARAAVTRLIATSRFMPTVAEIRAAAADIERGPVRSGAEAWLDVLDQIRREGYCGTPLFDDAIVASLIERWGWTRMCLEGNVDADRARFIEAYDSLAKQARERDVSGLALTAAPDTKRLKRGAA
jgi:hypothetical protein